MTPARNHPSAKPYTRWWWFSGEILEKDVVGQLDWLRDNGFGGVEIAWVYPLPGTEPGPRWLSREWTEIVAFAKQYAESIGLGCDFTFGSLWPFGGSIVPEEDSSRVFDGFSRQRLRGSWEAAHIPEPGRVLNHLDRRALSRYASIMGAALKPALDAGSTGSALFCDSWEVETEGLWTPKFDEAFQDKYGYSFEEFKRDLDQHPNVRYDYRKLIADFILEEFYKTFASECHKLGALSRIQCHGSPTDLLAAYAAADIPETESILFEPPFAKFAASAAALSGKTIVSCETFTCLYGWKTRPGPAPFLKQEKIGDLKLLAEALIANGVNQIVWHGMPFNPENGSNEFYAGVHVGPDSSFADHLPEFNAYMENLCSTMRRGRAFSEVAVYLPLEDVWMAHELPPGNYAPDTKYHWELRFMRTPEELKGWSPLWVSKGFLADATVENGRLVIGEASFRLLYINIEWLDEEPLDDILRLARMGLPVCIIRKPSQPGRVKTDSYIKKIEQLFLLPGVTSDLAAALNFPPIVTGDSIPDFWCRTDADSLIIFFANPGSKDLHYPLSFGQSESSVTTTIPVEINFAGKSVRQELTFKPNQSLLLEIHKSGSISRHEPSPFHTC